MHTGAGGCNTATCPRMHLIGYRCVGCEGLEPPTSSV
jgi:hypothetical protein